MNSPKIEQLPEVLEFEGLYFDPQTMKITVGYIPAHKSNTVCQLQIPLEASSKLAGWMIEALERLTGDLELGRRLNAVKLRSDNIERKRH